MESKIFKIWTEMQHKTQNDAIMEILDDERLKHIKDVLSMHQDDALEISDDIAKKLWDIKMFYSQSWDNYLIRFYYPEKFMASLYYNVVVEKKLTAKKAMNKIKAKIQEKDFTFDDCYQIVVYKKNHTVFKLSQSKEIDEVQKWSMKILIRLANEPK